jgi:hypothetical protein
LKGRLNVRGMKLLTYGGNNMTNWKEKFDEDFEEIHVQTFDRDIKQFIEAEIIDSLIKDMAGVLLQDSYSGRQNRFMEIAGKWREKGNSNQLTSEHLDTCSGCSLCEA